MKNIRQVGVIVAVILVLAGAVIVWLFKSPALLPSEPAAVPQARSVEPATPQSTVGQVRPVQANPGQPGAVGGSPDTGEATPEFVTEPVVEEPVADVHDHDENMPAPSQATIDAIREIRKPAEGEGQVVTHSDGTAEVKLGNRFQSVPVATVGKDGKVHVDYHGEKYLQPEAQQPEVEQPNVQKTETHQP